MSARSASPAGPDAEGGEFYIGWAPTPPGHRRFLRLVVLGLFLLTCGVAVALVTGLQHAPRATFEYGKPRLWRGRVALRPAPLLWTGDARPLSLVAPGKHGADALLAGLDGADVELHATLIERAGLLGPQRMLEIDSLREVAGATPDRPAPPAARPLGHVRWRGEIADGKCYLGVMVPGEGKTHRDCAARCISGGTPPMLALADGRGGSVAVLLAAADGAPLGSRLAPFAGEPVWVSGELAAYGDLIVLSLDPTGVARVDQ
jgi:hypothetical protein